MSCYLSCESGGQLTSCGLLHSLTCMERLGNCNWSAFCRLTPTILYHVSIWFSIRVFFICLSQKKGIPTDYAIAKGESLGDNISDFSAKSLFPRQACLPVGRGFIARPYMSMKWALWLTSVGRRKVSAGKGRNTDRKDSFDTGFGFWRCVRGGRYLRSSKRGGCGLHQTSWG